MIFGCLVGVCVGKPEEEARRDIDALLELAGWHVQDYCDLNLGARTIPRRHNTTKPITQINSPALRLSKSNHRRIN